MNVNKLGCRANQPVFDEFDERITALEEGSGGTEYTAGTGIDITEDVISVDSEVIYDKTDVDTLLAGKQDVLTPVSPIQIVTEDDVKKLKLKGFSFHDTVNWFTDLFDVDTSGQYTEYYFKYDTILCIRGYTFSYTTPILFFPKGLRFMDNSEYKLNLLAGSYFQASGMDIFANGSSTNLTSSSKGVFQRKSFEDNTTYYTISDGSVKYTTISKIVRETGFNHGIPSNSINFAVMVR